jgi:hypothetical protein
MSMLTCKSSLSRSATTSTLSCTATIGEVETDAQDGTACNDGSSIQCACNAGCATLLLPLQGACADFLASVSMRETRALIERAAPTC